MNLSLRTKTIIGVGVIEAVLLAILIANVSSYMRSTTQQQLEDRVNTTTSLFATTTKDAVLSYDLASLEDFTREVMKNPGMVYARVTGPDNVLFSQTGEQQMLDKVFVPDISIDSVRDGVFDSYAEIVDAGVVYGRVEIGIDTSSIDLYLSKARKMSASIALIEMMLVALFSFLLGGYLTGQLKSLRIAAKQIAGGKLDVYVPVRGQDEIAEVASAFNRMTDQLQITEAKRNEYENQLKDINATLEDRVRRRTTKLEAQNQELSAAYEKLQEAQSQLLQSEKMASVGQLAAGVAHEINNPVGFVNSNLISLQEYVLIYKSLIEKYQKAVDCEDKSQRNALEQEIRDLCESEDIHFVDQDIITLLSESIEGTRRVRDIVSNLKNFSHADTTEQKPADINHCIESTLKMVNNELKYTCTVTTDLQKLPPVLCVEGQVNQIFLNLVINASHAIDQNGKIDISSRHNGKFVVVTVRDNGCGISDQNLTKLFDPFFTTKPIGEGTGLGLAIVYGIVQDHGGKIFVTSEIGKGTEFVVSLPVDGRMGLDGAETPENQLKAAS